MIQLQHRLHKMWHNTFDHLTGVVADTVDPVRAHRLLLLLRHVRTNDKPDLGRLVGEAPHLLHAVELDSTRGR